MTDYSPFADIIRDRVSVQDVGRDFGLQVGRDGRCKCVFCGSHRKDTLKLYPGSKGYFCFSCHASGDVIKFYREMTGSGFREAIEEMNSRYGLGLPIGEADPEALRKAREESMRRKQEAEQKKRRDEALLGALWDAGDAVWMAEKVLREEGPKTPGEAFSPRYEAAAKNVEQLREWRDRIELGMMKMKEDG